MKNIIITIDTTDRIKNKVTLKIDAEEFIKEQEATSRQNQELLPMIIELLQEHKLDVKSITAIEVNKGPGSFTGIRVGVSVANALSFALQVPVNGKVVIDEKTLVEPSYGA